MTTKTNTPMTKAPVKAVAKAAAPVAAAKKTVAKPAVAKPAVAKPAKPAPVQAPIAKAPAAEQPVKAIAVVIETPAVVETIVETVKETVTEVAAKAPVAIKKEITKMNDTIKDAAEKGQAYFTEFTAKAKAAAEKGTKAVEEMNEFTKGNVEALVESGKIAAKGFESMGQGYAEYTRKSFESTTAALKGFAAVKSPTDFFKMHSDFVRGQFDSMVAETSKNTEAMMKLAGEIAQPISNRVSLAAEKLKIAA